MKLKFEFINGYGVLVDEKEEIISGDLILWNGKVKTAIDTTYTHPSHKIIFAEKELGLDVPVFEWRDFEPNEKSLLSMFYNVCKATYPEFDEWIEAKEYKKWLNKSNQAKFTEEDLQKAFHAGEERILKREYEKGLSELDSYTNLKKSLQKYPQYVVMESDVMNKDYTDESDKPYQECEIPRIFTNSDGKQQGIIKELIWES
jgi:hypothetical protein